MENNNVPPYIAAIVREIMIEGVTPELEIEIRRLGASRKPDILNRWDIGISSENKKAELLTKLRDLGIPFGGGPNWSPGEQFEDLRDKGLVSGSYKEITWWGPQKYTIVEK